MQVAFYFAGEITQALMLYPGSVVPLAMFYLFINYRQTQLVGVSNNNDFSIHRSGDILYPNQKSPRYKMANQLDKSNANIADIISFLNKFYQL